MRRIKSLIICTLIILTVLNNKALATDKPIVRRLEGKNRIETAIEISKEVFSTSKTAILVGYKGEVDALTGTILAEKRGAPILISNSRELVEPLAAELKRLEVEEVFILGGFSVVERQVEADLISLGIKVTRINGNSREETAIKIADEAISGKIDKAFLSLGYGAYADALAIGPVAASKNVPLLLTQKNQIKQVTIDYLKNAGIKNVTIVGGQGAVGLEVENTLRNLGIRVDRIKGNSREETAINIAKAFIDKPKKVLVANGYKYADAVAGGYLAARENSPILLNNDKNLKDINLSYIEKGNLDTIILGGNSSIDESIYRDIKIGLGIAVDKIPDKPVSPIEPIQPIKPGIIVEDLEIDNINKLKEAMRAEMDAFSPKFTIEYKGKITSDEVRASIRDIFNDGSYISGAISGTTSQVIPGDGLTTINFTVKYYNSLVQEDFIDKQVDVILKKIIRPDMDDFQKVRAVHDYIVNNTEYSKATSHTPHSAYSLFKEGKGVCQAYALGAYKLLDKLGIENHYVVGKAGNVSHAWNLVKIGGSYYNLDVTKNDPLVTDGKDILSYKYFLVTDETISKTHKMDRPELFPRATDKRYEVLNPAYNPFEYKGSLYFGNKDDSDKMYSVSLETLKATKISDQRAPYLVVSNDQIYFSNYSAGGYLYRMGLNGKGLTGLNKIHSTHLRLEGTNIIYTNNKTQGLEKIDISKR